MKLKGKTVIITGASRGIGQAIALKCAKAGAQIVILSKDTDKNLLDTADQIRAAGGDALSINADVSSYEQLQKGIEQAIFKWGSIDILINNTSVNCFRDSLQINPEQFDIMIATSARAALFLSQLSVPYLKKASNPHIVNISPPLYLNPESLKNYLGFALSKYAMSLCTLGLATQLKEHKIAVNSLWPKSAIATQTVKDNFSDKVYNASRYPAIMGDAAYELITREELQSTGQFYTDEELLQEAGQSDFSQYTIDPSTPLMQSLFIPQDDQMQKVSEDLFL